MNPLLVLAQQQPPMGFGRDGNGPRMGLDEAREHFGRGGHGGGILLTIGVILILVAIGLAIWALVRTYRHRSTGHHHHAGPPPWADPALNALRMRFAQGEIDAEEFERRATLLTPQNWRAQTATDSSTPAPDATTAPAPDAEAAPESQAD